MSVEILVEGGGESPKLKASCRRAFGKFFERAGLAGRMPRVIPCGSRERAFDKFKTALAVLPADTETMLLLVDSEGPIAPGAKPWSHLAKRDGWKRPPNASDDDVHFMTQCMESWFLADAACLAEHFGQGFKNARLPANPKVEDVHKDDVLSGLKNATRACRSGPYSKGNHSFVILAAIDPAKVKEASPYAKRLINAVHRRSK